jgi:hypothetical protein
MRKLFVLGLAVLSVSVFGAVTASGASAETVWLVGGALTGVQVPADIEGLLTIDILSILGLVLEIHCVGIFDGWVGPDAEDEITKVLKLVGGLSVEVGALGAEGTGVDCEVLFDLASVCNNAAKLIELWPDNLPWGTLIELMAAGEEEFLDLQGLVNGNTKEPGFDSMCLNSGGTATNVLCEGAISAVLKNEAGGFVLGTYLEAQNEQPCTDGNTAMVSGEGEILTTNGTTLAVSEG